MVKRKHQVISGKNLWDRLNWRKIDTSNLNLGFGDDAGEVETHKALLPVLFLFTILLSVNRQYYLVLRKSQGMNTTNS